MNNVITTKTDIEKEVFTKPTFEFVEFRFENSLMLTDSENELPPDYDIMNQEVR